MWWTNSRVTIHVSVIEALRSVGYELRNTMIWDRTNIVNNIGIFGWPSNYITMGTTFEYLLDFWRPESRTISLGADNSSRDDTTASEPHMDQAEDENTTKLNGKARSRRAKKKETPESISTSSTDLQ